MIWGFQMGGVAPHIDSVAKPQVFGNMLLLSRVWLNELRTGRPSNPMMLKRVESLVSDPRGLVPTPDYDRLAKVPRHKGHLKSDGITRSTKVLKFKRSGSKTWLDRNVRITAGRHSAR